MKYAISACLMGRCCKYNASSNYNDKLYQYMNDKDYVLVCPECAGGLPTPRIPSEIVKDRVINARGEDVSEAFYQGAKIEYEKIKQQEVELVILQSRSPSCGVKAIYDGSFSKKLVPGMGIFATLVHESGIKVVDVEDFIKNI